MRTAVYIDTNVLIAAFEMSDATSDQAWRVLDAINEGALDAVTSELTLAEVLTKPFAENDVPLRQTYEVLLCSGGNLQVVPVNRTILIRSAQIRAAQPRIRLPDAIHLATAVETSCPTFLTSDQRISRGSGIRVVLLAPTSLEEISRPTT